MSEASVSIALDTRKTSQRKDGKYPIKIRLTFKSKSRLIAIGKEMAVDKKDWNFNKDEVRSSATSSGHLKSKCTSKLNIALTVIENLKSKINQYSIDELKKIIKSALDRNTVEKEDEDEKEVKTVIEYVDELASRIGSRNSWSHVHVYNSVLNSLLKFHVFERMKMKKPEGFNLRKEECKLWLREQGKELRINEFTHSFLKKYETYYLSSPSLRNGNGIESNLKIIRCILKSATKEGHLKSAENSFSDVDGKEKYKIKGRSIKKRAINPSVFYDFQRLYNLEEVNGVRLQEGSADWEAVALLVFMWEANAMNFKDIVKLKVENFRSDVLNINRSKTSEELYVVKSELCKNIVNKFSRQKSPYDFLFKYGFTDTEEGYKKYNSDLSKWTKEIRRVAKKLNCLDKVSSYVLRHTFATEMFRNGVNRNEVGMMFGHKDSKSIDYYISSTDPMVLAQKKAAAEQLILKSINQKPSSADKEAA